MPKKTISSSFPSFHKLSMPERLRAIHERGLISSRDFKDLLSGKNVLSPGKAETMIENVVGVMGLPVGLGLNFLVNGHDYVVPMAVEEPSIVAAVSAAAKVARKSGGFDASSDEPILIGQIQVIDVPHPAHARARILQNQDEILNLANSLHPRLVSRGGGAVGLEVVLHTATSNSVEMLVVHLLVDTRDAMGANLVNTMCEGVAAFIEKLSGGKVFLRILSNLADRSIVRAHVRIPVENLKTRRFDGEQVRDGIIIAAQFADIDPYRATTHNKGIMNGIDAVALATGNDWRSIEAGAHAYASRGGRYTSLTRWSKDDNGALIGEIEIPLKVGIVGGSLQSNPTVAMNLRLLKVKSARELGELMGAVGLAQNFSALRALATEGIQQGHMTLHARSVAASAGVPAELFDTVVERLIAAGEIKIWKAEEILEQVRQDAGAHHGLEERPERIGCGHGKIILFGEHAVVYGSRAIAAPIPLAVRAEVASTGDGVWLLMPRWDVEIRIPDDPRKRSAFEETAAMILSDLGLDNQAMRITVYSEIPRAMGLGGSAAVAVAIIRALNLHFELDLSEDEINRLAFRAETLAHGKPSGIDNTVATFGRPVLFRAGSPAEIEEIDFPGPIPLVIGISGKESLTAKMVSRVRRARKKNPTVINPIFRAIDALTGQALGAIRKYDLERLGNLMNVCHGLLNSLQVSSWEIEEMVQIARERGALGAKLTGGGGGGSMIALCPDCAEEVSRALEDAGYQAMQVDIGQ